MWCIPISLLLYQNSNNFVPPKFELNMFLGQYGRYRHKKEILKTGSHIYDRIVRREGVDAEGKGFAIFNH